MVGQFRVFFVVGFRVTKLAGECLSVALGQIGTFRALPSAGAIALLATSASAAVICPIGAGIDLKVPTAPELVRVPVKVPLSAIP